MENNQKKVYIETLGCQMNKADSENILGILNTIGYKKTNTPEDADFLIINTCTIRASAEDKAFSYLGVWGKLKKKNPELIIGVCGCVAQQKKELIFKRAPYVDIIFGTHNINELAEIVNRFHKEKDRQISILKKPYEGKTPQYKAIRDEKITAWVNIIEGCDYFCSYCIVPYVRGRQRSRNFNEILKEVEALANEGYKEITLLGQTVDSYGNDVEDKEVTLPNLLRHLNQIDSLFRIRFVTSHPKDITEELIETVAELDKVCEYFHIPMQSGNTEILQQMKRGYTAEEYRSLVKNIRSKVSDVGITSDFIVAFPGETNEQFMDTVRIVDELMFDQCNTAMFSPRKQTPAATWKDLQLTREVKKQRINILNEHVKQAAHKANEKYLNTTQEVLVEGVSKKDNHYILNGRTRNNKITHFIGDINFVGNLVNVKIVEITPWSLRGEVV